MPFEPGTRLGAYDIIAPLGAGGMGEVYRANDSQLEREVAIKVLARSAADPESLARFNRECKILASLNHPSIATVYGVVETAGQRAMVMELVKGETLAAVIQRGAMPLKNALSVARQIALALEAAHDKGIVHRDLKPGNVMVTPSGVVKVLDFGLAAIAPGQPAPAGDPNETPTLTLGRTIAGSIMGTASYMSPEQAEGMVVDKRADVWSYGTVLWEMLAGKRLFEASSVSRTLADVLRMEIDFTKLPSGVPAEVVALLRRCLDREVLTRLRDIGEARVAIDRVGAESHAEPVRPKQGNLGWIAAGVLAAALAGLGFVHLREAVPERRSVSFEVAGPPGRVLRSLKLSPDGRYLAFLSSDEGPQGGEIYVRALDSLEARNITHEVRALNFAWSPDSRSLAFYQPAARRLLRLDRSGGPQSLVATTSSPVASLAWLSDGALAYSASRRLYRVDPNSAPVPAGESAAVTVDGLPDGRLLVQEGEGISVVSKEGKALRLLSDRSAAAYAPPRVAEVTGHILFVRQGTLLAQPFDLAGNQLSGDAVPIVENLGATSTAFSVSANGVLAYRRGAAASRELVWVDRNGVKIETATKPFDMAQNPAIVLTRDDARIAVPVQGEAESDYWIADQARKTFSRFTFEGVTSAVWAPDGKRLLAALRDGRRVVRSIDGSGAEEDLFRAPAGMPTGYLYDWSPDGKWVAFTTRTENTQLDISLVPTSGDRKPVPFVQSQFVETWARFSPDSKWISYASNESGATEIWMQAVPPGRGRWQISTNGSGQWSQWRGDGTEIYYREGPKMMAVPIRLSANAAEAGKPRMLFENATDNGRFLVSRDGQRFLLTVPAGGAAAQRSITVVTEWQNLLKQ